MAEQELDRNEAATPYKLERARERGQVSKSADIVSVAVFTAAMAFLAWRGWQTWRDLFQFDAVLLAGGGREAASATEMWILVRRALGTMLTLAIPFFGTVLVAAVLSNVAQAGIVLSVEPLKPDWSRLSPTAGFKRLFSVQVLFVAGRSALKLVLLSWVVYLALKGLVPHFYALAGLPPAVALRTLLGDIASLGLEICLMLWFIAILDLVYTRRHFATQMRMSRREVKEEVKHREGDPRIRARLRELRREMLKRSMALRKTSQADVLITNPTHVAVALRYVHGQMPAPQLIAKGAGLLAAAMRRIAARHRIPVVQNPSLARRLFHELEIDQSLPPGLYAQVARIIVWVFAMRDAAARRVSSREEASWTP